MVTSAKLASVAGIGMILALAGTAVCGEMQWGTSYTKAKKAAKEGGQLMMIDFWAEW